MQECRDESEMKSTTANYPASSGFSRVTANGLNFRIINLLMEFWGVRLTWLDCKHRSGAWVEGAATVHRLEPGWMDRFKA